MKAVSASCPLRRFADFANYTRYGDQLTVKFFFEPIPHVLTVMGIPVMHLLLIVGDQ